MTCRRRRHGLYGWVMRSRWTRLGAHAWVCRFCRPDIDGERR